jgi:hypothetical protein
LQQFAWATVPLIGNDQAPSVSSSQPAPQTAPDNAPVPAQIAAAHTVFVANLGADPNFPIDPTVAYDQVYAALQTWGYYQLVNSPERADLVFQLRDVDPITGVAGNRAGTYSITTPAFQLTILDPHSQLPLWTINSPVLLTGKKEVLARWQAIAVTNLVSRAKVLANQPLSPIETADLTTVPRYHNGRVALIAVGAVVGAGIAGGFILNHEFENSLANQKASQDAFCEAHNIPLSDCAGG